MTDPGAPATVNERRLTEKLDALAMPCLTQQVAACARHLRPLRGLPRASAHQLARFDESRPRLTNMRDTALVAAATWAFAQLTRD